MRSANRIVRFALTLERQRQADPEGVSDIAEKAA
jgi:hypothetical protein